MADISKPTEDAINIGKKFLLGDLIRFCVDEMKKLPMGWAVLPEKQQKEVIDRLAESCEKAVTQVVELIAANDRPHVICSLESVTFKDGVKMQLEISKMAANRHELADAQGSMVVLVIPRVSDHLQGDRPKPMPDQPGLSV